MSITVQMNKVRAAKEWRIIPEKVRSIPDGLFLYVGVIKLICAEKKAQGKAQKNVRNGGISIYEKKERKSATQNDGIDALGCADCRGGAGDSPGKRSGAGKCRGGGITGRRRVSAAMK